VQEVIPVKRRSPYRLVDVKAVVLNPLLATRATQACWVGIDISKYSATVCLYWPDKTFERPWQVKLPDDLPLLIDKLRQLHKHCPLLLAMESSGTYGDALRQAATDAGLAVHRVSGLAVKGHAEAFDGVPSQHDGKDAAVIAELACQGKSVSWSWQVGTEREQAMRYWVAELDRQQRIRQIHAGQLEALLARHWPEAQRILSQSGATLVRALSQWQTPTALAADLQATTALARIGGARLKPEKIAALIAAAKSTVGVRLNDWSSRQLRETAQAIVQQRKLIAAAKRQLRELAKGDASIQGQKPAVGLTTACVLRVCLGDVRNYSSAGAYRKAMGLNLKEHSSGKYKGKIKISKRGKGLCRKWLYFSALRLMRNSVSVRRWTEAKKQRDGGHGGRATIALMRRLALAAYHVGANGEAFEADRLFAGKTRRSPGKTRRSAPAQTCSEQAGSGDEAASLCDAGVAMTS
jgi:transposase